MYIVKPMALRLVNVLPSKNHKDEDCSNKSNYANPHYFYIKLGTFPGFGILDGFKIFLLFRSGESKRPCERFCCISPSDARVKPWCKKANGINSPCDKDDKSIETHRVSL